MFNRFKKKSKDIKNMPFDVRLVLRTTGTHAKRGIHSSIETIHGVIKVDQSHLSPYVYFDFGDATRRAIHHDRLLDWQAIRTDQQ